ncbi:MAG: apolipoprotein N-acyltransferase [Phycisphaerae bacterium]
MKKSQLKSTAFCFAAFAVSAILLTLIQRPFGLSFLAWVAYVPIILIILTNAKTSHLVLTSYLIALIYWLGNIYWMGYVTISGWLTFCVYTAMLWPVLIITIRAAWKYKIPLLLAVPVLIVGVENLQGFVLGGFYWRHLSHSQYANTSLIQIADIFGAAGVSFLVALVNALVVEFIIAYCASKLFKWNFVFKFAVVLAAIISTLYYGKCRIEQSDETFERGPIVAAVQSNLPQSVKDSGEFDVNKAYIERLIELSRAAVADGAELVVWPETIVPSIMDKEVWHYLLDPNENLYYHRLFSNFSRQGVYLLIGSPGGKVRRDTDGKLILDKYNSAFLYEPVGDQSPVRYSKIDLVLFGEIVPFKQNAPWLYNLLMKFSPYDYDYNLTPGSQFTVFNMKSDATNEEYKFGVMICYESTIPAIARNFALDENGDKKVDWLVNISNDGWFVKFDNGRVEPSTELAQHAVVSTFRAVENRLSVLRSVNTGISCFIDPLGRVHNGYLAGNLPDKVFDRGGVEGYFTDRVIIDSRVTFFSRFGRWLDAGCAIAVLGTLILLLLGAIIRNIR